MSVPISTDSGLLRNRVALVTGASRGIGRAIALAMAREGAAVMVNAHVSRAGADAVVAEIQRAHGTAAVGMADVADGQAVHQLIKATRDTLGPIDILVNNAGSDNAVAFEAISAEEWDRVLNVNLKAAFLCCREVLDDMQERRSGAIICISSVGALRGSLFGNAHYSASKAGLHGLVMTLARHVAPHGIRVNAIAPGPVETEMFRENVAGPRREEVLASVPLGFIGQPEDIAHAAVFLASHWARYITGTVLNVSGGIFMG